MEGNESRLFSLFTEACRLETDERRALLERLASEDPALAAELTELLDADSEGGALPEDPQHTPLSPDLLAAAFSDAAGAPPDVATELDRLRGFAPPSTRYEVGEQIGAGAMGRIERTWDRALGRSLARKTARTEPQGPNAARTARFLNEARVTGRLEHPGVVPVYDMGVDDEGRAFFTMREVQGEDLSRIFARVRAGDTEWTLARALDVLGRVCETMSYAHARGVLHRDLKPDNIMVGQFGEVYVMDWGVARVRAAAETADLRLKPPSGGSANDSGPLVTMDGAVVGTPFFMPPEQARGEMRLLDERADVYAVGAMLYELLSGKRPYQDSSSSSPHVVLARVLAGPPKALAQLAPEAPPELVAICEHAMAPDPGDRYAAMEDLARDLRAFVETRVVAAYRTGPWIEARKWVQRNRALALAIATTLVALVAGLTAALVLKARSDKNADLAERNAELADTRADVATDSLDLLVYQVQDELDGLVGERATSARTRLLGFALDAIERLRETELQPDALSEKALESHLRLGGIAADIARVDVAERELQSARDIARERLAADPQDVSALAGLARALLGLAKVSQRSEVSPDAFGHAIELASAAHERWAQHSPDDLEYLHGAADCLQLRAELELRRGATETAEEYFRESLTRVHELVESSDAITYSRAEYVLLTRLGLVHETRGDWPAVLACYQAALEVFERIDSAGELTPLLEYERAKAQSLLAHALYALGREDEAIPAWEAGLKADRQLSLHDRNNAELLRTVSVGLERMGNVYLRRLDSKAALEAYEEALSIARRCLALEPSNELFQRDLTVCLEKVGDVHYDAGRFEDAVRSFAECLELRRERFARASGDIEAARDLSFGLTKLAQASVEKAHASALARGLEGEPLEAEMRSAREQALEQYAEAVHIRRELCSQVPGNVELYRDVAIAVSHLGDEYLALGDSVAAIEAFSETHFLLSELARDAGLELQLKRDLAVALTRLARSHAQLGEYDEAEGLLRRAAEHSREEIRAGMLEERAAFDLSRTLGHLVELYQARGLVEKARPVHAEACEVFALVPEDHPAAALHRSRLAELDPERWAETESSD